MYNEYFEKEKLNFKYAKCCGNCIHLLNEINRNICDLLNPQSNNSVDETNVCDKFEN